MDPRSERSRAALRGAVLALASDRPVDELTVAEVCRAAGLTRDTFYRHAPSPVDLLATTLAAELTDELAPFADADGSVADFAAAERALLLHVLRRQGVYLGAMRPSLLPALRANLEAVIVRTLESHLRNHPASVPAVAPTDDLGLRLVAGYAAGGTVSAIEHWLRAGARDVEEGARLILAASPAFWFAPESSPTS